MNLYLIRGLPGSGKSTFAEQLAELTGAIQLEADMYHLDAAGNYNWKPENVYAAHKWCQDTTKRLMILGADVIVSNTSTTEKELAPYLDLAEHYGYRVTSMIIENRHGNKSVHDVPEETMDKMRNRFSVKL